MLASLWVYCGQVVDLFYGKFWLWVMLKILEFQDFIHSIFNLFISLNLSLNLLFPQIHNTYYHYYYINIVSYGKFLKRVFKIGGL